MTSPKVEIDELDGQLGILPPDSDFITIVGDAASGPFDTPAAFSRVTNLVSTFTAGRAVEAAAYAIEHYGLPVLFTRTAQNVAATNGSLAHTFDAASTSVPTIHAATVAYDDYEVELTIVHGGTVGTTGITLQWSADGGRTLSQITALGTATNFVFPGLGGLRIDFAAGTLTAGDTLSVTTKGPSWDGTALGTALDALGASAQPWEFVWVVGDAVGADVDTVQAKLSSLAGKNKFRWAVMSYRMPTASETDAQYQTAFAAAMSSHHSVDIDVQSGACKALSSISFRQYRRPSVFGVAPLYAAISEEQDAAKIVYGPLPGIQIRDENGNLDEHDEDENPGLDDLRSTTLRTFDGSPDVFVNNPRIFSAVGSDFEFVQYRRVMNLAKTVLHAYLRTLLSREIVVSAKTGRILESEAVAIDSEANALLEAALLTKPKASSVQFVLSRSDNLLSTKTLTYDVRIVPLGYAKVITGTIGFNNPALRIVAVAA